MTTVAAPEGVEVEVTAEIEHRCPFVNEADHGTIVIRWTCTEATLELHELRTYLNTFRTVEISHEALAETVRAYVATQEGIEDVSVRATFRTAQMTVTATA